MIPDAKIHDSVDHLFRRHAGQMVSILARRFGYQHLERIEDAVQDALVAAMKKWPFTGEPENARAWLIETHTVTHASLRLLLRLDLSWWYLARWSPTI